MVPDYWLRQSLGSPLFPQLEWSRPETKHTAGKLAIVGGNLHGFAAPAEAYAESVKAGIGTARALLPDATKKIVGPLLDYVEYTPSTPSGSFAQRALAEVNDLAAWADAVLFAGDLGRNSETAILIEKFLAQGETQTTITKDAADYITSAPHTVLQRPNTVLVLSIAQLQRLASEAKFTQPITFGMDLMRLVDWLHDFTCTFAPDIIVRHLDTICVAVSGQVSTTKISADMKIWRVKTAAHAAVWLLQNTTKPFEALTTAIYTIASGAASGNGPSAARA
ncbi:MAG TPA: hypothetical protein VHT70_05605 [Candidatus Saccharimonadales bacterium]|jgi:hypothetical protein|nr:hypothetical protein [Candidatus Saccharimonadales bacterium]